MIEAKNPNLKISAKEVMSAFSKTSGSNYLYQISKQKEQLRMDELWAENLKADEDLINQTPEDEILDLSENRLLRTFSSESVDSGMFWTFAPYVYKNLPDKSARDRLRKIFNWAILKNVPKQEISQQNFSADSIVHLKGLEELFGDLGGIYYLTIDPNNLTHKFTDQEAQKLVKEGVLN